MTTVEIRPATASRGSGARQTTMTAMATRLAKAHGTSGAEQTITVTALLPVGLLLADPPSMMTMMLSRTRLTASTIPTKPLTDWKTKVMIQAISTYKLINLQAAVCVFLNIRNGSFLSYYFNLLFVQRYYTALK